MSLIASLSTTKVEIIVCNVAVLFIGLINDIISIII